MNFFATAAGWLNKQLKSLFKIWSVVSPYMDKAEAIVTKVAMLTSTIDTPGSAIAKLTPYLNEAVKESQKVKDFVTAHSTAPTSVILREAAAFILKTVHAPEAAKKDVDFAIQSAYNILKLEK